eukprot:5491215-Pyramimonas_sp.AAC.1
MERNGVQRSAASQFVGSLFHCITVDALQGMSGAPSRGRERRPVSQRARERRPTPDHGRTRGPSGNFGAL